MHPDRNGPRLTTQRLPQPHGGIVAEATTRHNTNCPTHADSRSYHRQALSEEMKSIMFWVKSFHIIFVVAWFAGLLYLPRLFVYHCDCDDDARGSERFKIMERKLFAIMTIGGSGAILFGIWMLPAFSPSLTNSVWLPAKLVLVAMLTVFHYWCWKLMRDFRDDRNRHTHKFYRLINEIPAITLIAIVILVVVKPG